MDKLYGKREDGSHFPTTLHKELGRKADEIIEKLFNELLKDVDIVEAKYIIDYSVMDAVLDKLLDLK